MLRRMVNNHALRLVPGWNFSELLHALRSDSWTRSSARETEPDREIANARRFLISASNSSLKLAEGIFAPLRPGSPISLETGEQFHELVWQRRLNQAGVVGFERPSDCLYGFRVGRCDVQSMTLLCRIFHTSHRAVNPPPGRS